MIPRIPETYRNQDWPRKVAQTVNQIIARQEECCSGGLGGGGSFDIDDNTGAFLLDDG